jgi:hypothetical protein
MSTTLIRISTYGALRNTSMASEVLQTIGGRSFPTAVHGNGMKVDRSTTYSEWKSREIELKVACTAKSSLISIGIVRQLEKLSIRTS